MRELSASSAGLRGSWGEDSVPEDEYAEMVGWESDTVATVRLEVCDVDASSSFGILLLPLLMGLLLSSASVENGRKVDESSSSSSSEFSSADESALSRNFAFPFVGGKRERREYVLL